MPLTKAQGLFLSNDELLAHLLENEKDRIELAPTLPFMPVNGHLLRVERVSAANRGAEPTFDAVGGGGASANPGEGLAVPAAATEDTFELKLLVQDVIVADYTAYAESNVNSQPGVQLELATRRMLYKFWKTFYAGDASVTAAEFSGIRKLTIGSQTITTNDVANFFLQLEDLARLVALIRANNGRPHVLFTGPLAYKNIQQAYYNRGMHPDFVTVEVPDANGGMRSRKVMAFDGTPIYRDDNVLTNETVGGFGNGTSIYAICLGRGGLYGIVPAAFGSKMIRVKEVLVAGAAHTTYRVYWPVSLVLETQDAIARLQLRANVGTT